MHADLKLNHVPAYVLDYHEDKVEHKAGECIWAENFIKDHAALSYEDKLYPFRLRASYNDRVQKKMFHTALLFGTSDDLSNQKMAAIGREYMREMGYGDEPYLIYRHRDAAREHLHLVSTNIDREGDVIGISKYDLLRSYAVTERLARKYGVEILEKPAESIQEALAHPEKGLGYMYPIMNEILEKVVPEYRYTDLAELNAVLRLYGVQASRGKEYTVTYQKKGLHYHPLQEDGQPAKQYLPARRFPNRPTLANLEKRFVENRVERERHRNSLTVAIDFTLAGKGLSLGAMREELRKEGVSVVTGEGKEGAGRIWWVDHDHKTVFEGSALGADYSFAGMQKRLLSEEAFQEQQQAERQTQRIRHSF